MEVTHMLARQAFPDLYQTDRRSAMCCPTLSMWRGIRPKQGLDARSNDMVTIQMRSGDATNQANLCLWHRVHDLAPTTA